MAARMVVAMVDKFDLTPVPVSRDYCLWVRYFHDGAIPATFWVHRAGVRITNFVPVEAAAPHSFLDDLMKSFLAFFAARVGDADQELVWANR
jgi:hypothetical protein